MEISFYSIEIRNICENLDHAISFLGDSVGKYVIHRLADIDSAKSIKELVIGELFEENNENAQSIMKMKLPEGWFMYFSANHQNNPIDSCSKVVWENVKRIKIISFERTIC